MTASAGGPGRPLTRIKFICCDVFARLACAAAAVSPHIVDVSFMPMLKHIEPDALRRDLQARVDDTDPDLYARIVLGYGLCGNATAGLKSALPLVMPRTHDCCAVFMGSRERFVEVFGGDLSMRWCTCGYFERSMRYGFDYADDDYKLNPEYLKLLADHGEDNAEYVWQTMHPPIETNEAVYIRLDGFEQGDTQAAFAEDIAKAGKTLKVVQGDLRWFNRLVNGPWDPREFLLVPPGHTVEAVYDLEEVVRAVPRA